MTKSQLRKISIAFISGPNIELHMCNAHFITLATAQPQGAYCVLYLMVDISRIGKRGVGIRKSAGCFCLKAQKSKQASTDHSNLNINRPNCPDRKRTPSKLPLPRANSIRIYANSPQLHESTPFSMVLSTPFPLLPAICLLE